MATAVGRKLSDSQEAPAPPAVEALPRICMPTWRNFTRKAFQCGLYEAQDVLAAADSVELLPVEARKHQESIEKLQRWLLYYDFTRHLVYQNPGLQKVRLTRDYDIFLAVCQSHPDFLYVNAIENWKDRCRVSLCWLDEIWVGRIPLYKYWLHALRQYDYVFVGSRGSVDAVSQAIGKQVYFIDNAVDALLFSPYPDPPRRVIDVYSIGRRSPGIHDSLLNMAQDDNIFYSYDTARGADNNTHDHRQHRFHFANMAKRSRYFLVAPGKLDDYSETRGQVEYGPRYYEGAAAGAVLLGQKAERALHYNQMMGWQDSVIEIKPDGSDVASTIAQLNADPHRLSRISRRNAVQALLRHDWIYRWKEMFQIAGIEVSPGMRERERQLKALAALAEEQT